MKIRFTLVLALLVVSLGSSAQSLKVLFVGNSYTFELPDLVANVATSAGDTLEVMELTQGGQRLSGHAANMELYNFIRDENFDYVILQAQSQETSFPDGQVQTEVFPYAQKLCDSIHAAGCTIPMFYMTWGRENGDHLNCNSWPPVCTYEGMDSIIYSNYQIMGRNYNAEVSPAGAVWHYLRDNDSTISLYDGDGSHPNSNGLMANAYTFYTALFRKSPYESSFTNGLDQELIDSIQKAVYTVLFENLDSFNIGVNDPQAAINSSKDGCSYRFSAPIGYDNYNWDFGDGDTSTQENIDHNYATGGTYTVKLTVEKCGVADTDSVEVKCGTVGLKDQSLEFKGVYPNPSTGKLTLAKGMTLVSVSNSLGQELNYDKIDDQSFFISEKGVCLIKCQDAYGRIFVNKALIK